jgi:hypothetical protein
MKRKCDICDEEFNNKTLLTDHLLGHLEEAEEEKRSVETQLEEIHNKTI